MIIVTGHVIARKDTEDTVERLALEHVLRSRMEAGCVSHEVSRDVQQPLRFVFIERWSDLAALQAHFRVEASRDFAHSMASLCEEAPQIDVYEAEVISIR
ncbi:MULTISPECIES: putative quinol monooxygenase [unclassified Acidovorax]|uniref:putative quinol monooxygenase n=1 Tax=unclassified Acidovorax TaxID=2684926 RepID=UPI001C468C92|nr:MULTISPECIES: putative quinol monooxygenase [unclassified Acidovorax]MBV7428578.1 antibiotic biosynthesis monooxygenase [Acidovorax sp. sif0732]MBV7450404.1 antibiotic biosynthesis monooxygenase [Acidovorax sp. sif0715]